MDWNWKKRSREEAPKRGLKSAEVEKATRAAVKEKVIAAIRKAAENEKATWEELSQLAVTVGLRPAEVEKEAKAAVIQKVAEKIAGEAEKALNEQRPRLALGAPFGIGRVTPAPPGG